MNRALATKYQTVNSGHFEIHYPEDAKELGPPQPKEPNGNGSGRGGRDRGADAGAGRSAGRGGRTGRR